MSREPARIAFHFFLGLVYHSQMRTLILATLLFMFIPSLAGAQPAISFSQPNYDFTSVERRDKVEHAFEFSNTGDQELVIEKLTAS
jgi:hypothetical protein